MYVDTKETSFLHDLSKPSLESLSHILRHKELWPKDFTWYYLNCENCAMGLAWELWDQTIRSPSTAAMSEALKMPVFYARDIFLSMEEGTTPEQVADRIDAYLKLDGYLASV